MLLMALMSIWVVTMPLDGKEQLVFGLLVFAVVFYLRRYAGSFITLVLIALSVLVSTRYLYWRATETLNLATWMNATFSIGLLISEAYAWMILIMGLSQSIWPLNRQSTPLPDDQSLWPVVDVLIPTYNEPLSVVRTTILAAKLIEWPADKLKIYILDDGHRDEFKGFAEEVGVGYITRTDNRFAKAGNLNNALKTVTGEYVAIFDCDHMPTSSFLKLCMGGFLADPKLALVQTPHHFLTPDPFERNLGNFRKVPNEGELFYGLVQDGNDFWNAAFFCGSCAILKRSALDEIGGIATDTVTEDAHTSLNLHRKGYNSAYLKIPLSAGLATETLSAHVHQRMRWARGMAQMFRLDCPLLGKGLSMPQRLCYTNSIFHFLYGFPRLFFLLSPLTYLFFENSIINAPAWVIAVYALPHLVMGFIANSRLQGEYRHSFWNEVYEASLAWYIMWPTLFALINPKKGKFNVTAKGGHIKHSYFDWKISLPYVVLFALNAAGLAAGFLRMFWFNTSEWDTALLNIVWTVYNLIMISAVIAVALESRQVRKDWRVDKEIPTSLSLGSGQRIDLQTQDYSMSGVALKVDESVRMQPGEAVTLHFNIKDSQVDFPAEVIDQRNGLLRLKFDDLSLQQEQNWVAATLSRDDAWHNWLKIREEVDHPLWGLKELLGISRLGVKRMKDAARQGA